MHVLARRNSIPQWCKWSITGNDNIKPNDYLVLFDNTPSVHIVIRRLHSTGEFMAIPKYIGITSGESPWSFAGYALRRILSEYSATSIAAAEKEFSSSLRHSPLYGRRVPSITVSARNTLLHCSGLEAFRESLKTCTFEPLCSILTVLPDIFSPWRGVRVTGSLLLGSLHSASDIDMVIGSYLLSIKYIETVSEKSSSLVEGSSRCSNDIHRYRERLREEGFSKHLADKLARTLRFCVEERPVSVSLVSDSLRLTTERRAYSVTLKPSTQVVRIDGYDETLLDFPGIVETGNGLIVAFDSRYALALFLGGCYRVSGVKGTVAIGGEKLEALFLGIRESRSSISLC